jgi:hypothetical protein
MIFWNRRWEGKFSPTSDICGLAALPKDKELAIKVSCCVNIPSRACKISFTEISHLFTSLMSLIRANHLRRFKRTQAGH